jgi:hypothetical protein
MGSTTASSNASLATSRTSRRPVGYWVSESPDDASRWTLRYTGICEAKLDRGRRSIEMRRSPQCDPDLLPAIVVGSVLAHALMAEGRLVLQASAVERGGRALAIAGPLNAGKSTLAALGCGSTRAAVARHRCASRGQTGSA